MPENASPSHPAEKTEDMQPLLKRTQEAEAKEKSAEGEGLPEPRLQPQPAAPIPLPRREKQKGQVPTLRFGIGSIMLLLGGLAAVHFSFTTMDLPGDEGGMSLLTSYMFVVIPLLAIGGIVFLRGLIRLVKQMPIRLGLIASLVGVGLIVGLPLLGGEIAQTPIFLGPYPLFTYQGHSGYTVAWSPDGKRIASGSGDHNSVEVWDASTGQTLLTYRGHSDWVAAVAWSPDGKRIASASYDGTVQVWDAATGQTLLTYRGHSSAVTTMAWSPDGKRIASGAAYPDGTVQVWDAVDGSHVFTFHGPSPDVNAITWSPDGKRIATGGSDNTVQVWDAVDGSNAFTYRGKPSLIVEAVAWSPDGKRITWGDASGYVTVLEVTSRVIISSYNRYYQRVTSLAWSPDGKRIAAGYDDGTVRIWDAS